MKAERIIKRFWALLLMSMLIVSAVPGAVFAEEAPAEEAAGEAEGGEEETGGEEGELSEEEALAQAEAAQAALETVVPSDIATNIDGKYIALSFPASEVPEGFAVKTVDYQGQQVMLAYMTSKSSTIGAAGLTVTLAYLTDADGNNGEFYLCDTTENAKMSDMIMIEGTPGRYIIILDPGDNVVGPDGFTQHKLQWGSKTAVAWSLPEETVDEDATEEGTEKSSESASLFGVNVYAAELNLTAGEAAANPGLSEPAEIDNDEQEGNIDEAEPEDGDKENGGDKEDKDGGDAKADDNGMLALDEIAHTNASGLIQAQPKDFCLLYAIDESANLGFYLYDIERGTYQRYVDIPKGESAVLVKYKKLSRTRLFIIIVLAIFLVIMIFVLVNLLMNKRGDEYDDDEEDPEEEAMRRRAKAKERKSIGSRERAYLLDEEPDEDDDDFEDDYEDEDEDDEDYEDEDDYEEPEEQPVRHRSITRKSAVSKKDKGDTEVDWENMEITAGLNPKKTNSALEKNRDPKFDFDEDFDFEFLDIKK